MIRDENGKIKERNEIFRSIRAGESDIVDTERDSKRFRCVNRSKCFAPAALKIMIVSRPLDRKNASQRNRNDLCDYLRLT